MIISKRTKVKNLINLIKPERMEEFIKSFPPYPLKKSILSMSIGEFANILLDEDSFLNSLIKPNERAYIAFGRLHQYSKEIKDLSNYLSSMQINLTPEEQAAGRGVDFPSFVERMLLDCVKTFHLHSMVEAEQIPLTDYLVVLKDQISSAKYQRNYNKILEQKSKTHRNL